MLKHCLFALTLGSTVMMTGVNAQTTQPADAKLITDAEKLSYHLGVIIAMEAKGAGDSIDIEAFRQAIETLSKMDERTLQSYSAGIEAFKRFKETDLDFKPDKTVDGIKDTLANQPSKVSPQEAQMIVMAMVNSMQEKQAKELEVKNAEQVKESMKKLDAWTTLKEAKTSPSGMRYVVHAEGEGPSPTIKDTVSVDYTLTLLDGTLVETSEREGGAPLVYNMDGSEMTLIKGFIEALQGMKKGAHWTIALPPDLAWGPQDSPAIPANSAVIFELKVRDIKPSNPEVEPEPTKEPAE